MQLDNIYRLDYPFYPSGAVDGSKPTSFLSDRWIEEQPLGLFFQFSTHAKGLFLYEANDAEQVCHEVRDVRDFLHGPPNFFGFVSPVSEQSELSSLIGANLQKVYFGTADGYLPGTQLLFGIKLQFESASLAFVNNSDEGLYLFESSAKYQEYFTWFSTLFTNIEWQESTQVLKLLAQS